jgi:hypothetical protein
MINQLPDLEKEDKRYNLHVGAELPETFDITLIYPTWIPTTQEVVLQSPQTVRNNLAKLGIFL